MEGGRREGVFQETRGGCEGVGSTVDRSESGFGGERSGEEDYDLFKRDEDVGERGSEFKIDDVSADV